MCGGRSSLSESPPGWENRSNRSAAFVRSVPEHQLTVHELEDRRDVVDFGPRRIVFQRPASLDGVMKLRPDRRRVGTAPSIDERMYGSLCSLDRVREAFRRRHATAAECDQGPESLFQCLQRTSIYACA